MSERMADDKKLLLRAIAELDAEGGTKTLGGRGPLVIQLLDELDSYQWAVDESQEVLGCLAESESQLEAELAAALSNVDDLRAELARSAAYSTLYRTEAAAHLRTQKERIELAAEVLELRAELAAVKGEK